MHYDIDNIFNGTGLFTFLQHFSGPCISQDQFSTGDVINIYVDFVDTNTVKIVKDDKLLLMERITAPVWPAVAMRYTNCSVTLLPARPLKPELRALKPKE